MKSSGVGSGSRVQDARRSRPTGRPAGSAFATHLQTGSVDETPSVTPPTELMGVDALLALQDVGGDSPQQRRKALQQHGESVLDRLDQLRTDLLLGRVSPSQLVALTQQLRARPSMTGDAQLDAIMGEIELRAEVELAKLDQNRNFVGD
jgi:Class II flagellar assembly regulator.